MSGNLGPGDLQRIWNLALASGDESQMTKLQKAFVPGHTISELQRTLPKSRFSLFPFGTRSCLVIDLELPMFAEQKAFTEALTIAARYVRGQGFLELQAMRQDERQVLTRVLARAFPSRDFSGISDGSAATGLILSSQITLELDGRSVTVSADLSDRAALARQLQNSPVSGLSSEEARKHVLEAEADYGRETALKLKFYGGAKAYAGDFLEEASKAIKQIMKALAERHAKASWQVGARMERVGETFAGAGAISSLNEKQRSLLSERLQMERQALGLSGEEAKTLLDRARGFTASTVVSLAIGVKSAAGGPPVFYSIQIGSYTNDGGP